jgi:hypothetical protein
MMARRKPGVEALRRFRHRIRRRDPDDVEAEGAGAPDEGVLQKSRSA